MRAAMSLSCSTAVSVLYAPECSQHVRGYSAALSEIDAMPSDQQINPEQVKPVQDQSDRGATRPKRDITLFQR